ncbi:unnamed protein product [Lepeophtheirus salmonis]|uniref:(salmon louse) hypothetical protein n=1 Tax=Lepeophtheirus salmonis TaxID=72036 RepID=A0A7R8CNM8_LEPSM|nr:unnamed protein product [Lepeophtheirus salmonis]CAF2876655.1 unnamed protein product [Lepeophtheirus salmonis]
MELVEDKGKLPKMRKSEMDIVIKKHIELCGCKVSTFNFESCRSTGTDDDTVEPGMTQLVSKYMAWPIRSGSLYMDHFSSHSARNTKEFIIARSIKLIFYSAIHLLTCRSGLIFVPQGQRDPIWDFICWQYCQDKVGGGCKTITIYDYGTALEK